MSFREEQEEKRNAIQEILHAYMPEETGLQKDLISAMHYSIFAGGKRLRPMLVQETYRLLGGTGKVVEPFMAAMEMIHTHSLIHDDLPALDNDDYRRGRKTTHVVYGEAMAILAGDALLNFAYETACKAFAIEPGNPGIPKALSIMARKTGIYGMLGGQSLDVEASGKDMTEEKRAYIYEMKTSALIESSMMIGAVLAGADDGVLAKVEKAGKDIGMAFQIQDDILDQTSTSQILGKPVHSDAKNQKDTYVAAHGLEQSKKDAAQMLEDAMDRLKEIPGDLGFFTEMIQDLGKREK